MFYIEFNGYKKDKEECEGLFSVGKTYACDIDDSGRYYQLMDDDGKTVKFSSIPHDSYYSFSRVDTEEESLTLSKNACDVEMKYRMNDVDVTKSFFNDKLLEVEALKSRGVTVFIDFEVSFE